MSEKRLPLSLRLYQQQQQLERELYTMAHPAKSTGNPLHLLDPAAWGELNYYIEDRIDPETGQNLGNGLIILSQHQKRIIRHAVARVLNIEQMFGSAYAADGEEYSVGVLYTSHQQQHKLGSTNVLVYDDYGVSIPDTLSYTMPTQDQCKAVLQFIIACSLGLDHISIPLAQVEDYLATTPHYSHIQKTLHNLAPDSNFIAGLHKLIVTSTRYKWSTIAYSCPKKSGKTRLSALMSSWLASHSPLYSEIYFLANDGKASQDRVLAAVVKGIELAKKDKSKSEMVNWSYTKTRVELPEGQFMEAIPVDPEGEAGSQPTGTFWTELWGYGATIKAKEKLWTELTIPPTRWGQAIRWVDSYAGFEGESTVLWDLYLEGVDQAEHPQGKGRRHPKFDDLPVYINERAGLFCYWDHEPRMVWQTPEYYAAQAATMPESEFRRVHRNEWASALDEAIPIDRWDQLAEGLGPVGKKEPIILGVDLSVSGDYSALVVVSKHPQDKTKVAIRGVYVWEPPAGKKIDYSTTIMPAIRRWVRNQDGSMNYNVVCVTYDEYQAHLMSIELTNELGVWWEQFSQGKGTPQHPGRPVADKMFFDLVMSGRLSHDGNVILRQHIHNAAAKTTDEGRYMRFVKKREDAKIDALVAASMAVCMISTLNV